MTSAKTAGCSSVTGMHTGATLQSERASFVAHEDSKGRGLLKLATMCATVGVVLLVAVSGSPEGVRGLKPFSSSTADAVMRGLGAHHHHHQKRLGESRESLQPLPQITDHDVRSYEAEGVTVNAGSADINKTRLDECMSHQRKHYKVDPSFDVDEVIGYLDISFKYVPLPEQHDGNQTFTKLYEIPLLIPKYALEYGELRDIQRQVLEIHLIASETCGADPLDNETTAVTLFEDTSPSCDERMREEVDAVHRAHVACRQVWDGIKDSLEPYKDIPAVDGDAAHYSNLPALFSELENLWNRRNAAGRAYDAAWETWSMDEDAARVSCGYADNYRKLKASISTDLTDKFKPDMKQIQSLCDEMPTDEAFTYSKTAYTADQPTSAHRSLHSTPGTIGRLGKAACQDMIDYTETTVDELSLQGISRSACLDHHCRMDKGKLDKTTLHIRDKYTTWKQADDIFRKGHAAYVVANDKYAEHLMMLEANNLTLNAGLLGLHFAKKGVDHAMDLLKITAACPASSICCVEPKEMSEICGKGKVDDVHSVTFELSPPSPPPPSPPPSPPAPNPPAPSPPSPPPTPSPSTPPAPPPSPSTPSDDSSSLPTSSEDSIQPDGWTGVIGAESPPPTLPSMPRSPPTPPDWPSIPDLPPASENPIRSDGWIGVLGLSPSPPPASPLSSPPPWPPRSRSTPPDDYAPPDDLSLPPPPSRDPDDWFDIRISGSKNTNLDGHDGYYAGRIEIRQYKDGVDAEWRTVCSRGPNGEFQFTDNDAKVACRMLGFATKNSYHFKGAFWGEGRSKNIYRGPRCKGNELNFAQCLMDETPIKPSSTCGHDGDVGIVCTVRSHPVGCDDPHCKGGDGVS